MYNEVKELQSIYKEIFMDAEKEPRLGDTIPFGAQTKIYTLRGWVICDNHADVEEEQDLIKSYNNKEWQSK